MSCMTTIHGMSEKGFKKYVGDIEEELGKYGFEKSGVRVHGDKLTYGFSNADGRELVFTLDADKEDYKEMYYIEEVELDECRESGGKIFSSICGDGGVLQSMVENQYKYKDIDTKVVSTGKTLGLTIPISIAAITVLILLFI